MKQTAFGYVATSITQH